jgi:hypothetical protein
MSFNSEEALSKMQKIDLFDFLSFIFNTFIFVMKKLKKRIVIVLASHYAKIAFLEF